MAMKKTIDLGLRRELMLDDFLVGKLTGAIRHRLHNPVPKEVALVTDRPWEGNMCGFVTVLRDPLSGRFRMYYRSGSYYNMTSPDTMTRGNVCMAESDDGIRWERPSLDIHPIKGYEKTNIVYHRPGNDEVGQHGFCPFYDSNPNGTRSEAYKAVGSDDKRPPQGIYLMEAYDGVHWKLKSEDPFFTKGRNKRMKYDSQNVAFWDPNISKYRLYFRDYDENSIRCICTSTSPDFKDWSEPEWLAYGPDAPVNHLYTNNIQNYYRAPHILMGFPARYTQREWSPSMEVLPELEHRKFRSKHAAGVRCGTALTDGLFMSSRDGKNFKRWDEAFFRPGLRETGNWAYGDNFPALGMLETDAEGGGKELSFYAVENYWRLSRFRRHTLRIDGFVSLNADFAGGEMTTKAFTFKGFCLSMNISTSAAGNIRVEIQTPEGKQIEGYGLGNCNEIVGDSLDYPVSWKSGRCLEKLSGKPIRLRIKMHDADLYSLKFTD
jgi:hypothetical protein